MSAKTPTPKPTAAPAHWARLEKTSEMVLASLASAYGWTEKTKLARVEFQRQRDAWLNAPASASKKGA